MYCPTCGTEAGGSADFCPSCGEDLRDRTVGEGRAGGAAADPAGASSGADAPSAGDRRPAEAIETAARSPVPAGAAAIDIACPLCGRRPIEETATGHRMNAYLVFYTRRTYELVGCHACIRRKLWWMSAKNLVLGWWGIRAAVINAALTAKNLARGAINRGPNANLQAALEDIGVTYDYLDDPGAFDPSAHSPDELYIRSFVRLGTAIMLADGTAHPAERRAIHDAIGVVVPGYPVEQLDDLIERASRTEADVERVAAGIGELLGQEGKQLVIAFVATVADAGETGDEDIELVATIAHAMGLSEADIEATLAGGEGSPVSAPG